MLLANWLLSVCLFVRSLVYSIAITYKNPYGALKERGSQAGRCVDARETVAIGFGFSMGDLTHLVQAFAVSLTFSMFLCLQVALLTLSCQFAFFSSAFTAD